MPTIKGMLREMERAEKRRARANERAYKLAEKEAVAAAAAETVENYESLIYELSNMHADVGETWDWQAINSKGAPFEPTKSNEAEESAQAKFDTYIPGRADRLMRRGEKKRFRLETLVDESKEYDEAQYQEALQKYQGELAIFELSRRILNGEAQAYIEAIEQHGPWHDIPGLAQTLSFVTDDPATIKVEMVTFGEDQIPDERYKQLKSGKLSTSNMPKSQYWQLYQDYVCGTVLRVARETFALVPTSLVVSTVLDNILNPSTGHLEDTPILSAAIPRATIDTLNLDYVDPSDAMSNFVHNMKFMKTKGLSQVERVDASALGA